MGRNFAQVTKGTLIYICFVKNRVDSGNMLITYCSTQHMLAYLLTKALQGDLFVKLREVVMV